MLDDVQNLVRWVCRERVGRRAGAWLAFVTTAAAAVGFACSDLRAQEPSPAQSSAQTSAQDSGHAPVVVQPGAPGQPTKTLPPTTRATLPPLSQADVEFMQGMIMHHSQAVEMTALIPSHTENKDVRALGAKISSSQSDEIKFMERWLATRGQATSMTMAGMPGMDMSGGDDGADAGDVDAGSRWRRCAQARGAEFDRLFLTGMIQHHNGALIMAKDLFDTPGAGQDAEIFNFATDVDNTQRAEIRIMQSMLDKEFKEKR